MDGQFRRCGLPGEDVVHKGGADGNPYKKTGRTRMQGSPDYPRQYGADRLFAGLGLQAGNHHIYVAGFHRAWVEAAQFFINLDGIVVLLQAFV